MVLKILAGFVPVAGCAVAIPFMISGGDKSIDKDRGRFHLGQQWKGCVNLLEEQSRRSDKKAIYLCKLDDYSNKLEMIYYDSTNGTGKEVVEKIQSIRQSAQGSYGHASKLILKLEKSVKEETLDRPTMLFDYTGGSNHDDQNLLFPDKECTISPKEGSKYTFSCTNPAWLVVKPAFSLI